MMAQHLYSRVPAAAVYREIDGNIYARIPHGLTDSGARVSVDYKTGRIVLFNPRGFIRNGEAFVWFASLGDALPLPFLPYGVECLKGA